jgi:hypothetical protein
MARLGEVLCPEPPRRIPGGRALGVALRTAHLSTFGALVGGHLFQVDPDRLWPFLVATALSGAGLVGLELASTCAWLVQGKGAAVVLKLGVLALVPVFWDQRLPLLLVVGVIASVGSHMPARFRHRSLHPVLLAAARRPLGRTRGPDPRRAAPGGTGGSSGMLPRPSGPFARKRSGPPAP